MKVGDRVTVSDDIPEEDMHISGWPRGQAGEVVLLQHPQAHGWALVWFYESSCGHGGHGFGKPGEKGHWWVKHEYLLSSVSDPRVTEMVNDYVRGLEVVK